MDDSRRSPTDRMTALLDLYTHHLFLADFVREWAAATRHETIREPNPLEIEYLKGYARALDDIADHLEAGDALPGGPLHEAMRESSHAPDASP